MSDKIQMTEEQAKEIYENCISEVRVTSKMNFLRELRGCGYIKKSELQQKVEEVEEKYREYEKAEKLNMLNFDEYDLIQLLKKDHPEFKHE